MPSPGFVRFKPTRRHWQTYQFDVWFHLVGWRSLYLWVVAALGLLYGAFLVWAGLTTWGSFGAWANVSRDEVATALTGFLMPVLVLSLPAIRGWGLSRHPGATGWQSLALTPDGYEIDVDGERAILRWDRVEEIVARPRMLYLVRSKVRGIVEATFIPQDAFPSPADADAFLAEARRLWSAAHAASPPPEQRNSRNHPEARGGR